MKSTKLFRKSRKMSSVIDSPACRALIDDMAKRVKPFKIDASLRLTK